MQITREVTRQDPCQDHKDYKKRGGSCKYFRLTKIVMTGLKILPIGGLRLFEMDLDSHLGAPISTETTAATPASDCARV